MSTANSSELVLIVEDDPNMCHLIACWLERGGFEVQAVHTAEAALRFARTRTPQVIVTDYRLPGLSGTDLIEQLRRYRALASVPVIVLTASADEETERKILAADAGRYLTKPIAAETLIQAIEEVLIGPSPAHLKDNTPRQASGHRRDPG